MKYLLDTNIIVDHLRKKKIIDEKELEVGAVISIITLGELLYGVYKSDDPGKTLTKLEENLSLLSLGIENLNYSITVEFSKIKADLEKSGQRIEDFDLLIAATAKVLNLTLVTRNLDHFKRIKGLKIAD